MATRRSLRRENASKSLQLLEEPKSSTESGEEDEEDDMARTRSKGSSKVKGPAQSDSSTDEVDPSCSNATNEADPESNFASGMLLDVLAQVATDRLDSAYVEPPVTSETGPSKKLSKRVLAGMDVLKIEHIKQLTDKLLVGLFAELGSDEIARNYTYTCFLMGPEVCSKQYSSFGNEMRAKSQMLTHLQAHVSELLEKQQDDADFKFYAETIIARKKRLQGEKLLLRRSRARNKVIAREKLKYTKMRGAGIRGLSSGDVGSSDGDENTVHKSKRSKATDMVIRPGRKKRDSKHVDKSCGDGGSENQQGRTDEDTAPEDVARRHNEQLITELLQRTQPYLDHTYTTVFGPRWREPSRQDHMYNHSEDQEEEPDLEADVECFNSARTAGLVTLNCEGGWVGKNNNNSSSINNKGKSSERDVGGWSAIKHVVTKASGCEGGGPSHTVTSHVPTVRTAPTEVTLVDNMPIVSGEEVVAPEADKHAAEDEAVSLLDGRTRKGLYPPMPKSELAQRGRIVIPEEMDAEEDEDRAVLVASGNFDMANQGFVGRRRRTVNVAVTTDYERKLALKCIRELRLRKKEDMPLVCKICENNKSFTATATLLYHYRSHAGIKPFVCLICNTTFTRQHSLNYHMLIHNNQSRFTCKDCGRKFRHPSHFKEHMRRHTGETPFHCMDCPLRFKTRNTYKRHLRTRHLKLLTAAGIRRLNMHTMLAEDDEGEEEEIEEDEEGVVMDEEDEDGEEFEFDEDVEEEEVVVFEECVGGVKVEELDSSTPPQPLTSILTNLPPENTASNKLLQFCSQVVSQEAC